MQDEFDLGCVAGFLAVIEEGHYGRAAKRLHLTSSALTKRVQRLEKQLGVQLLSRGPTGVVALTAAGARFAHHAGPLLAHAREVRQAAQATPSRYTVTLGVPGVVGEYPRRHQLLEVKSRLHLSHPEVRLICVGVPYAAINDSILARRVDIMWGVGEIGHSAIQLSPLAPIKRVALVPLRHELADASEVHVEALSDLPVIRNPAIPADWMDIFCLGDVRPLRDAQIVDVDAENAVGVQQSALRAKAVVISQEGFTAHIALTLRALPLLGAPAVWFKSAYRKADRREPVLALLDIIAAVGGGG